MSSVSVEAQCSMCRAALTASTNTDHTQLQPCCAGAVSATRFHLLFNLYCVETPPRKSAAWCLEFGSLSVGSDKPTLDRDIDMSDDNPLAIDAEANYPRRVALNRGGKIIPSNRAVYHRLLIRREHFRSGNVKMRLREMGERRKPAGKAKIRSPTTFRMKTSLIKRMRKNLDYSIYCVLARSPF